MILLPALLPNGKPLQLPPGIFIILPLISALACAAMLANRLAAKPETKAGLGLLFFLGLVVFYLGCAFAGCVALFSKVRL